MKWWQIILVFWLVGLPSILMIHYLTEVIRDWRKKAR
jgi:hypothetical protein